MKIPKYTLNWFWERWLKMTSIWLDRDNSIADQYICELPEIINSRDLYSWFTYEMGETIHDYLEFATNQIKESLKEKKNWKGEVIPKVQPSIPNITDIPWYEACKFLMITSLIIGSSLYIYKYFYPPKFVHPLVNCHPKSHGPYISAENKPIHFHEHVQCIAYYQHNEKFEFPLEYASAVENHLGKSALYPIEADYFTHPFFYYYYKPGKHIINGEDLLYSLDSETNSFKKLDIVFENSEYFRRALVEHKYYPVIWWRNPLYIHELRPFYHYKFYKIDGETIMPEKQQFILLDPVVSCFRGENSWRPHLYRKHREEITSIFASKDTPKNQLNNWEKWWQKHDLFNLKQDWINVKPSLVTDFENFSSWIDNLTILQNLASIVHSQFFVKSLVIFVFALPFYSYMLNHFNLLTTKIKWFKHIHKVIIKVCQLIFKK